MFEARRIRVGLLTLVAGAVMAIVLLPVSEMPLPFRTALLAQQPAQGFPTRIDPLPPAMIEKQKRDLLKYNFGQMKKDAQELSELAKSLQDDLEHSNQNILSLDVITKAEKIEKLAKKIKSTAKDLPPNPSGERSQVMPLEE